MRIFVFAVAIAVVLFASTGYGQSAPQAGPAQEGEKGALRHLDLGDEDDDAPATRRYGPGEIGDMQPGQVYDEETGLPDEEPGDAPYTLD
jgi:hypothetical protein